MNNAATQTLLLDYQMPITVTFRRWNKWYTNAKKSLQGETFAQTASFATDMVVNAQAGALTAVVLFAVASLIRK